MRSGSTVATVGFPQRGPARACCRFATGSSSRPALPPVTNWRHVGRGSRPRCLRTAKARGEIGAQDDARHFQISVPVR